MCSMLILIQLLVFTVIILVHNHRVRKRVNSLVDDLRSIMRDAEREKTKYENEIMELDARSRKHFE